MDIYSQGGEEKKKKKLPWKVDPWKGFVYGAAIALCN